MSEPLVVTSVTIDRNGVKTYWYNGARPAPRKPRRPYRMDPQKHKVYQAERAAFLPMFGSSERGWVVVDLPELKDVQAYLNKITKSKWFRRTFRHWYGQFRATDGRGLSAHGGKAHGRRIDIRRDSRCRWMVLHEIAHALRPSGTQSHGPEYVKIYLQLVRHFLGRTAWRALYDACRERKVKMQVRKARTRRPITAEERQVLVERLARAREKSQYAKAVAKDEAKVHAAWEQGEP